MANTYTQLYIHLVFAVKGRQHLIHSTWEEDLYKYITAVIQNDGHKLIAINGMPDHIHIVYGLKPSIAIADTVKDIKRATSNWIDKQNYCVGKFAWQEGYGAFSYSRSQLNDLVNYVLQQKQHHKKKTFKEEYVEMLERFGVDYDAQYLFDFLIE
ncbi:MAG: IS200/IS605 family transposase [Chitinophagaceae bacterium]|nr:IS200/IS605 family transposase [Chitinophagaceae bacterium]